MSEHVFVGQLAKELDVSDQPVEYTKVILWYDDEHAFVAGEDGGAVLEKELPWATQQIANDLLASVQSKKFLPFTATHMMANPAVELGDAITVGGSYVMLGKYSLAFSVEMAMDASAPFPDDLDEEYPAPDSTARALKKVVTLGKSYYGTKITRKNGLEITRTNTDGTTGSRALLNSDVFALYDDDGSEALYFDVNKGKFKFTGLLNVADNFIVDELGNVTINGNLNIARGSLYWGSNFPYVSQFSDSASGPWHTEQTTADIYRRDSWDGGKTWGTPYQFVGKDGVDGSDARVPSYIKSTYIDETTIRSPVIEANEFNVYPNDEEDYTGSFNIYGMQLSSQYHMLAIAYQGYNGAVTPYVDVYSPDGADLRFNYGNQGVSPIQFYGTVDFSNATVSGLNNITATVEGIEGENPYIDGEEWVQIWAGDTVEVRADNDITLGAYRKENDSGKKTVNLALRMSREHERFHFYVNGVTWVLDEDGLWKL